MAGTWTTTLTGTSTSNVVFMANHRIAPVNVAYVGTGSGAVGTVSYSLDEPALYVSNGQYAASATWVTLATFTAAMTQFTGAVTFPVRGVKFTASGAGASDRLVVTVVQAGITNG